MPGSLVHCVSWSLLKLMSIESMTPSNHLILCHFLRLLAPIFPNIRGFSNESVLRIRWPKYWNFIFSNRSSNEYSGLISSRIDWFDFLAVQGILRSLLHTTNQKYQFFWCSTFLMVQLSYLYMTTGKTIPLTIQIFVGIVMSLLFNTLSRFVIVFLPRSKPIWKVIIKYNKEKCFHKIIYFQYILEHPAPLFHHFLGEGRGS